MSELSIFIDESGDFGEYDYHSPYYIITMVFHDQKNDIQDDLVYLETSLANINYPHHCVHAGPIIRNEEEYRQTTLETRKKILMRMMSFTRRVDIHLESFVVNKRTVNDNVELAGRLSKEIAGFIRENYNEFLKYDIIKVYYDNGQVEVTKILSSVLNALLSHVEFRKVMPANYRLFQVADLVCTIKLTELKMRDKTLSKSEKLIFDNERTFKKNYLKPIKSKSFHNR